MVLVVWLSSGIYRGFLGLSLKKEINESPFRMAALSLRNSTHHIRTLLDAVHKQYSLASGQIMQSRTSAEEIYFFCRKKEPKRMR